MFRTFDPLRGKPRPSGRGQERGRLRRLLSFIVFIHKAKL